MSDELFVLDDDVEALVEPTKADAPKKVDTDDSLKKVQADYQARLDQERQRREQAEKLASEREQDARKMGSYVTQTQYYVIANALTANEEKAAAAERELKDAMEVGDAARAAKANRTISRLEQERGRLEDGKAELERTARSEPEEKKPEAPKEVSAEDYINGMPAASQAWLRENKQFVTDPKLHQKMLAYANIAVAEGMTPHTPEFIDFLADKLGTKKQEADVDRESEAHIEPEAEAPKPKTRTTAAPVSRGRASISSINLSELSPNTKIRFAPAAEKRFAQTAADMGMDVEAYKRNVVKAIQDGKLPKNFADADYTPRSE